MSKHARHSKLASMARRRMARYLASQGTPNFGNKSTRLLAEACANALGITLPTNKIQMYKLILEKIELLPAYHSKRKPDEFYNSPAWLELRYKALKQHGAICQCCGQTPTKDNPLHVDHIKPRSVYPELALSLDNLQVLCKQCNLGKKAWDETDWRQHMQKLQ